MAPTIPYIACVLGAAALYVLLRPAARGVKVASALVGLGVVAWLLVQVATFVAGPGGDDAAAGRQPQAFFVIFSLIAVASAVRMITHSRPVYSALYFILVVLSSAGLFLLLQAGFMAFALVIVYAGAILITYMFVLMLAQQATQGTASPQSLPSYDVLPREPMAAVVVGFILLALFTNVTYRGAGELVPPSPQQVQARAYAALNTMPRELQAVVDEVAPGAQLVEGARVQVEGGTATVQVILPDQTQPTMLELPPEAIPDNLHMVGLDLVARFPVSLELAGVILLMAMFGAVVLARKQIELGEDEVREAAGMRRLELHTDEKPVSRHRAAVASIGGGQEQ